MNAPRQNQIHRPTGRASAPLLGSDRQQCVAMLGGQRSAGIHRAIEEQAQHEQRGSISGGFGCQDARDQECNDLGQESAGAGGGGVDRGHSQGRMHQGGAETADLVQGHRRTLPRHTGKVGGRLQSLQRVESGQDAGTRGGDDSRGGGQGSSGGKAGGGGKRPRNSSRKASKAGGWKLKTHYQFLIATTPINGGVRPFNPLNFWSMEAGTPPISGVGESGQNARRASNGAAFQQMADFLRSSIHTPETGLLSIVANPRAEKLGSACSGRLLKHRKLKAARSLLCVRVRSHRSDALPPSNATSRHTGNATSVTRALVARYSTVPNIDSAALGC